MPRLPGRYPVKPDIDKPPLFGSLPPLDLEEVAALVEKGGDQVVSESWLKRTLYELREGRAAMARTGQLFGLPQGQTL